MLTILCDHRERNGANPHIDEALAANNRSYEKTFGEISVEKKQMTTGDYAITYGSPSSSLLAVVERKTWKDLSDSIIDKRIDEQYERLLGVREESGCRIVVIMEGKKGTGSIPMDKLRAKLNSWVIDNVNYVETKDAPETARYLVELARSFTRRMALWKKEPEILRKKSARMLKSAAAEAGLYEKLAEKGGAEAASASAKEASSADLLTKRVERDDLAVVTEMWEKMGVSATIGREVSVYCSIKELVSADAAKRDDIIKTFRGLRYEGGKAFGARVEKLKEGCVNDTPTFTELATAKKVANDVLCAIPGIAKTAATALSTRTLREISAMSEKELSEVSLGARRLGPVVAARIVKYLGWKQT